MRYRAVLIILLLLLLSSAQGISDVKEMPKPYKKWLEQEVTYIISPVEREVFLELASNRERNLFIQAFWKQRDPTPNTENNEYKQEHYRRIEYANQYFGREVPKPGWMTDRGRIYIILGKPNEIQTFESEIEIYPTEVWFYQGMEDKGLPPAFNLMFFQDKGQGEYKLYSPINHGPQALLTSFEQDQTNYAAAYEKIKKIEPFLADISLTLISGEKPVSYTKPSLFSEHLLNEIETIPLRQVNDIYARKYLEYKDTVEVEYSTNYIMSTSLVKTKKGPHGVDLIQYAFSPERLSIDHYQDKYYTIIELYGRVSDMQDRLIYQFEKSIPLEFDQAQINQIKNRPFDVLDTFPIIPGKFKLTVLMKNKISKEFSSLERNLYIPGEESPFQMTPLMLAYEMEKVSLEKNSIRPFQIRDYQLYLPINRTFIEDGLLIIAYQIHGLDDAISKNFKIRYTFHKNKEEHIEFTKDISEYPERPSFIEKISLKDFSPAHYMIRVGLFENNNEIISAREEFDISHSKSVPRPWYYTLRLSENNDPGFLYTLGLQYFHSGNLKKAESHIKEVYEMKKDSEEIAMNLARIYISKENYKPVESILSPFIDSQELPKYQTYFLLALSYKNSGEFKEAVRIYKKAISDYEASPELLNPLGECLLQLKNKKGALDAWDESLKINPDQPKLRIKIKSLKNQKIQCP